MAIKDVRIVNNKNTNTTVRGTYLSATEPHANMEPCSIHVPLREPFDAGQNTDNNRKQGSKNMGIRSTLMLTGYLAASRVNRMGVLRSLKN